MWGDPSLLLEMSGGERSARFAVQARHKERALQYFSKRAQDYQRRVERGPLKLLRHRERSAVLELAKFRPHESMLDVGCGPGFYALEAKRQGLKVCALDALPSMVAPLAGVIDEVLVGDIERLRLRAQFDCVVCAGVLDFVLNPARAFANLCRLVAPGGRLVLLVPRSGLRGWVYRLDKMRFGVRINFFDVPWFQRMAERTPLVVRRWAHPLLFNTAVLLQHRAHSRARSSLRVSITPLATSKAIGPAPPC